MFRLLSVAIIVMLGVNESSAVGERAFAACREYAQLMLECHNILYPNFRVRVPIDLLLYPHMVLIGFRPTTQEPISWKCGGSLISDSWVLTAAHCVEDRDEGRAKVLRIGTSTFEFDEADDLVQERKVSRIATHPGYHPLSKYHDIALMKAVRPFVLTRDIRIACLHLGEDVSHLSKTIIGFGKTEPNSVMGSLTLMKVHIDLIDSKICNLSMKALIKKKILAEGITENQLCAGDYNKGGKDTCQGDSGGPLEVMPDKVDCVNSFPLSIIIGITSFGRDCGRKMSPGVYTRVSKYVQWIEDIVWPYHV